MDQSKMNLPFLAENIYKIWLPMSQDPVLTKTKCSKEKFVLKEKYVSCQNKKVTGCKNDKHSTFYKKR